mgnify:CR=1 FL=1
MRSIARIAGAALLLSWGLIMSGPLAAQDAPKRIIALGGEITEIVYQLGADDRLVGRDAALRFQEDPRGRDHAHRDPDPDLDQRPAYHLQDDPRPVCSERHTDPDLSRPLGNGGGHHPVQADRRQEQSEQTARRCPVLATERPSEWT